MLKQSPQSLAWTRTGARVPSLEKLLKWHKDAEDPYGRYCRMAKPVRVVKRSLDRFQEQASRTLV